MRAGYAHVDGDFAGGAVGHGPRVMVVRPDFHVVVVLLDVVYLVLCLYVAVLGDPEIDADP